MGRREPAGCGDRGGERIPQARTARAPLAVGLASVAVAIALSIVIAARSGAPAGWGVLAIGGCAVVALLVAAVFRAGTAVAAGVALLGAAYTVSLVPGDVELDRASPIVAAALLAVAELGYWSVDLRTSIAYEPGMLARRAALIAVLALGALAVGGVLLTAVDLPGLDGLAVSVAGAVAAAGAFVLLWRAVARA